MKKKQATSKSASTSKTASMRKRMSRERKENLDEISTQIADDLLDFLSSYSEHINVHSYEVQTKIEELAEAAAESMTDYEEEEEDDFLEYEDMDKYIYGDDDE